MKCRAAVRTRRGFNDTFVEAGREGKILAARPQDKTALVKWVGIGWPSAHLLAELEMLR